ncbi:TetR/AcrR family transcriptional regulator [Antrihabitans stalactiti]|jgi:AcrR family transcriptional regulator|uniref:TetR/AcrR family transcriptional regulator n=1 Tax=Antrihabitans stalactiti TaxID=2584121 RepID=A0A848KI14_9NOCA|nr:TetR/AcrR family transcriptional regulator [Antrihabitans stalactiti]NMN97426.1 TetR/AcrR family transcriptional regulator [Antrihabitans stalactiti]
MTADPNVDADSAPRRGRPKEAGLAERRRRQIVESAYVVFAERGYEATGISDLAAHAGVGQGTVYRYFASKREILDHVFDFSVERLFEAVDPETLASTPTSLAELVETIQLAANRAFALIEREPEFLRLILVEASAIDQELKDRVLGLEQLAANFLVKSLRRGIKSGFVRSDVDPQVFAHMILMLILPGLLQELRGEGSPENRERYIGAVVHIMMRGLCAPMTVSV